MKNIALQTRLLSCIHKDAGISSISNQITYTQEKFYCRKPWNTRPSANIVSSDTMSTPIRSSRHRCESPPVLQVHAQDSQSSEICSTSSFSSPMPSFSLSFCKVCYDRVHLTAKCPLLAVKSLSQLTIAHSKNMHEVTGERPLSSNYIGRYTRFGRFCGRERGTSYLSNKDTKLSQTEKHPALKKQ